MPALARLFGLVLLALVLPVWGAWAQDPIINYERSDPEMSAAIATAVRRLPDFLAALQSGSGSDFHVKVPIRHPGGREHIWMGAVQVAGDSFTGRIANEPVHLPDLRKGSPYQVRQSEISDWYFMRDGKMHGSYTTRVMLGRMPPRDAERLRAILAP